jgi:hypothetical protein
VLGGATCGGGGGRQVYERLADGVMKDLDGMIAARAAFPNWRDDVAEATPLMGPVISGES